MDPFHFSCPHCFVRLRVRDPLSIGRQIACPECGRSILLSEGRDAEGNRELQVSPIVNPAAAAVDVDRATPPGVAGGVSKTIAEPPTAPGPAKTPVVPAVAPRSSRSKSRRLAPDALPKRSVVWWRRPAVVAWMITGSCAAAFLAYLFLSVGAPLSTTPAARIVPENGARAAPPEVATGENPAVPTDEAEGAAIQTEQRLDRLGALLFDPLEMEGAFPPGTSPAPKLAVAQRLSWLALLADHFDDSHPPVAWDHAWNDPLNDPFIRRRLHEFQNPAVAALTGADGYPATHFVGVAGVGDDAPRLPTGDPRAGIFGDDRRTRLGDILDGASNTWLVLGVHEHLGSWGAGGRSTMRALTREPYVNGPDGFGTGSADSMLVLLADGSVRQVASGIDPRIARNMAAMADGLPAALPTAGVDDDAILSDTGARFPPTSDADDPADPPLEPEFGPEPARKQIDLAQSLSQRILLYESPRSRPLQEWLPEVAEMIGAPIRFDNAELGTAVAGLKTPVRLRLENTTVGDILEGLLKPAGLTFRVETDHIQLAPRR